MIVYVWVNYNISLTWILRPVVDDFPYWPWFQASVAVFGRDQIYPDFMETSIL